MTSSSDEAKINPSFRWRCCICKDGLINDTGCIDCGYIRYKKSISSGPSHKKKLSSQPTIPRSQPLRKGKDGHFSKVFESSEPTSSTVGTRSKNKIDSASEMSVVKTKSSKRNQPEHEKFGLSFTESRSADITDISDTQNAQARSRNTQTSQEFTSSAGSLQNSSNLKYRGKHYDGSAKYKALKTSEEPRFISNVNIPSVDKKALDSTIPSSNTVKVAVIPMPKIFSICERILSRWHEITRPRLQPGYRRIEWTCVCPEYPSYKKTLVSARTVARLCMGILIINTRRLWIRLLEF